MTDDPNLDREEQPAPAPPPPAPPSQAPPLLPPPPPATGRSTGGWVLPAAQRPAIEIGSIVGRAFDTLGREWSLFLVLAAPAALGAFIQALIAPASSPGGDSAMTGQELVALGAGTVVAGAFGLASFTAVAFAADRLWQGQPVGVADAVAGGLRALPRYVGVTLAIAIPFALAIAVLTGILLAIGTGSEPAAVSGLALALLVGVPVVAWLIARLALLGPVTVLEPRGVAGSSRRAWGLSRGHALALFLLTVAIGLVAGLPTWGGSMFAAFADDPVIAGIALAIATLVVQPLPVIGMVLAWGDRVGGRHADSPVMARGRGRGTAALLVFGLGILLFVAGFGMAGQHAAVP